MKIINPFKKITFEYSRIENLKVLDIGCGRTTLKNAVGLDQTKYPNVDIVADLNKKLPIESETFDVVHANQVLEHVENLPSLMDEIFRILKKDGIFVAHVPYFRSKWAVVDPTHIRFFCINTLDYFVKNNWISDTYRFSDNLFSKKEVILDTNEKTTWLENLIIKIALRRPDKFENSVWSNIFIFKELTFVLTK